MAIVFDGRQFVKELESQLVKRIENLKKRNITPSLESIVMPEEEGSLLYASVKKKTAERIGASSNIYPITNKKKYKIAYIKTLLGRLNNDPHVHGILIQLPLSKRLRRYTREFLEMIAPQKDVDGLRTDSRYLPAVTKAVLMILDHAKTQTGLNTTNEKITISVLGARGMVGRSLVKELTKLGYKIFPIETQSMFNKVKIGSSDIIITATGREGLVRGSQVRQGAVVIDVGSPKAEVVFSEAVDKASFITPVPGGVGPVTVYCLMENLVDACEKI